MKSIRPIALTAAAVLTAGAFFVQSPTASAQGAPASTPSVSAPAAGAPPTGGPGGPGGAGRMEEFRQRMNDRLKEQLKASDDEWSVIQPLLEKVQDKLRDQMSSRFGGMMGGPGGPGGRRREGDNNANGAAGGAPGGAGAQQAEGGNRPARREGGGPRGGTPETMALGAALADDNTTVADIKSKLEALRAERKNNAAELETSRQDLRKVLNMRQEAVLVLAGMLD